MSELWNLYDEHKNPLGKTHVRGEKLKNGEYHIVVDVLSVNLDGKILVTKRHPDKPFGGMWEVTGGSVLAGEKSDDGAKRELFEETGLKADSLEYRGMIVRPQTGAIHELYLHMDDFNESDIALQEGETVDFKLVTPEELYAMAEQGEFLGYLYNRIKGIFPDILGESVKGGLSDKKPVVKKLHHVSLKAFGAGKLDEAVEFYCGMLGLSLKRRWENGALINAGGALIEIFASDTEFEAGVIKHFALETDDVDGCVETVRNSGFEVLTEPADKCLPCTPPLYLRMAFVKGPLGEEIEFFKELPEA